MLLIMVIQVLPPYLRFTTPLKITLTSSAATLSENAILSSDLKGNLLKGSATPQPAIKCSKLTIETLEQARCETCSKLKIKIPKRRHWRCSGIFIVSFEHISHFACSSVSIVNFEQVNTSRVSSLLQFAVNCNIKIYLIVYPSLTTFIRH